MSKDHLYVKENFQKGQHVEFEGNEYKHLIKVLRYEVGQELLLVNGQGQLAHAQLEHIELKKALARISAVEEMPKRPDLILVQGLCKGAHLDWIVEKAVEFGVSEIRFFPAEKSELDALSENRKERLEKISIAALKQSKGYFLPKITVIDPIIKWKEKPSEHCFFASLAAKDWAHFDKAGCPLSFIVGPEKGMTIKEEQKLKALGAKPVLLSHQVLRAETAAIFAIGLAALWQR